MSSSAVATRGWACPRSGSASRGATIAVEVPEAQDRGLGQGLRGLDPERYGDLHHPGDASRTTSSPRSPAPSAPRARWIRSTGSNVEQVLAVGESQSAFTLTTYVNGVQPLTEQFDGFLIHSRGKAAARLGEPDKGLESSRHDHRVADDHPDRPDAPVIVVRDRDRHPRRLRPLRPASPTATATASGRSPAPPTPTASRSASTRRRSAVRSRSTGASRCSSSVLRSATWTAGRGGAAPPEAARLDVDATGTTPVRPRPRRQRTGGVRSPVVDAPVDVLSGLRGAGSPDRVPAHGQHHAAHRGAARRPVRVGRLPRRYEAATTR